VTRDIAERFNSIYGEVFVLPEARVLDSSAKVPGTDGEKMSKSYGNVIELFEPAKRVRKKVMSIKTDSTPVEDAKDPDNCSVFDLYRLFADPTQVSELADRYRAGGLGYGDAKQALFELSQDHFAEARERRELLENDQGTLEAILQAGAERARQKAGEVLGRARAACGLGD
jgi:tryptophanyl-tRNA synthetase